MESSAARPVDPAARQPALDPAHDPERLGAVHDLLLAWFAAHGRDLPWRQTRDPWAILVSEVMLQQIQVARAIPFYLAFLERFPTVESLAAAPLAEAIRVWGDLGRYRRVVNLHRAARLVVERRGGQIPTDVAALKALPGIGPYTAGAVACFAFGQDVAFADTNIRRVIHRLFVGPDLPASTVTLAAIDRLAAGVIPAGRGWDWNQGLMDFGATVCTARKPGCGRCPLRDHCRAYPAILERPIASDPARSPRRPAYRYEGSDRYYRGRVLARLRDEYARAGDGVPLEELGNDIRDGFAMDDLPWLRRVVDGLTKDGLAIAEERPPYDRSDGNGDSPEIRVKLPT
jgi:A/G-specific adenine glycosylase